jgi:trimeric autotransporter adhesin
MSKYGRSRFNINASFLKNLSVTSNANFLDQTETTSITSGGTRIKGGLGIVKSIFIGLNANILGNINITDTLNATGISKLATGSTIGNLTLANGSITDSGGTISFGDENLTTTGTLGAGVATLATSSTIGNLTLANGSITDSSGTITFGNENLNTSGNVGIGTTNPLNDLDVYSGDISVTRNNWLWLSQQYTDNSTYGQYGIKQETQYLKIWWRNNASNNYPIIIDKTGYVGIGRTPTTNALEVNGSASKTSAGDWIANSDERIKTDIIELSKEYCYNIASNFKPKKFKYIKHYREATKQEDRYYYGIIANDVEKYFPNSIIQSNFNYKIGEDENGKDIMKEYDNLLSYDGYELRHVMMGCIPHLIKENEELKTRLDKLETT